jgi:hypothetical protein
LDRADKTLFEMARHANVAGLRAAFGATLDGY